eukprot:COSAG01_NODE_12425_length_1741_cov_25.455542_1_plen_445_part_10
MAEQLVELQANIGASLTLIALVNDLLETQQGGVAEKITAEFNEILEALTIREEEVLAQSQEITAAKLEELAAHSNYLESLLDKIGEEDTSAVALQHMPTKGVTARLVTLSDPEVKGPDKDRVDSVVPELGSIDSLAGLQVATLFEAAAEHPGAFGFVERVMNFMSTMDASPQGPGLITADDMDMMIVMLEEFKSEAIMEQACNAICSIAGANHQLSRRIVEEGGVAMLFSWFEEFFDSEKVVTGTAFSLGMLAKTPENLAQMIEMGVVAKLLEVMECFPDNVPVNESCCFGLAALCKVSEESVTDRFVKSGRDQFDADGGIEKVCEALGHLQGAGFQANALRTLHHVGEAHVEYKRKLLAADIAKLAITCLRSSRAAIRVVEQACACVRLLLASDGAELQPEECRKVMEALLNNGAFPLMMECVGEFSTDVEVASVVCDVFQTFG